MDFTREITDSLKKWKTDNNRKPLVIRGARQVGKTTVVNQFAVTYKHSILLNLEKKSHKRYFEEFHDVNTLIEAIFLSYNIPSSDLKSTLLFIDEIQESPDAIKMLRYLYEEIPDLHVIAAGSLLEFAIKKVENFPVGRIKHLYMYPLNFSEFLMAIGHDSAIREFNSVPVKPIAHRVLLNLFNTYAIIGGMPEIIKEFIRKKSMIDLPGIYESLWETYRNDIEKYATGETERKVIKHIVSTAHLYIDQRIKFQNFGNSNYRSREVGEAFRTLEEARVIKLIYPSTSLEPPLISDLKKSPRLQFLDTGIVNHKLNIQSELLSMDDLSNAFKGSIIPHLITQELISLNTDKNDKPGFWVRQKRQASSEVDIIIPYKGKLIPVEIKSGRTGSLKSLHQFVNFSKHSYAVRIYGGEFKIEENRTPEGKDYLLMNLPYYLGTKIFDYLELFMSVDKTNQTNPY